MVKNNDYDKVVEIFKALSEPMRIKILDVVSCRELCACEILECLSISQSTLSHHMKVLISCDLVIGRKEATWMYYSINKETIANIHNILDIITSKKSNCVCNVQRKNCKK
ncbi:MAG: winged helix-turn-helix transcriptional regulator [Oligoflexia bacterium]|nr:winged helix-turn-helix transcriptional regulator [Oligoflexia bacterium]